MVAGGSLLCFPLSVLGYRMTGSTTVTMVAATVGWMLSGVPIDRYLESRFSVLKLVGSAKAPSNDAPPAPEEADAQEPDAREPEEEQA